MKAIVSVLGKDRVGLIAKVSAYLAECSVNVEEVSQTVVAEYFNMLMIVDITHSTKKITELASALSELGTQSGVVIRIQHEDIFNCMHKI